MRLARLYPQIQLTRTITGRLSTTGFPVLGMPKHSPEGRKIRQQVKAPDGYVVYEADYSQIELRALAELSGDAALIEAYMNGVDIHTKTAHEVLGAPAKKADQDDSKHRLPAKTGNFSMVMGTSPKGLTESIHKAGNLNWSKNCPGCKSYKHLHAPTCDSENFIAGWFSTYNGARRWIDERREIAASKGIAFGMWGMEWALDGAMSPIEDVAETALRQSHALPVQEGAQRLIKLAMAAVFQKDLPWAHKQAGPLAVFPLLQIHDSLLWLVLAEFVKAWDKRIRHTMETITEWKVPIVAEGKAGPTWLELKALS